MIMILVSISIKNCKEKRDLAMIDLLYSTGIRVGELVNLNIDDINFEGRECIVYGKGDKERRVYFDAKTKVHLKQYLETRFDHNEALFVTLDAPHERLKINVTTNVEYDIVTGWLTDDGEVKSVTINGKKEFDSDDKYRLDAEVVVTYHTLKKNKPK